VGAGDLLLVFGVSGAVVNTVFSNPTGFTQISQISGSGNTAAPNLYMGRKFAVGGESGTLSCPHTNVITSMAIMKVPGVDSTTPLDIAVVEVDDTTSNSTLTIPSQTLTTAGDACVYVAAIPSTSATMTPPSGFTEDIDHTIASTRSWEIAHKTGFASGASGAQNITLSGSAKKIAIAVFLRPAVPPTTSNIYYKNSSGIYVASSVFAISDGAGGWT
jgi:hypothetical protein